MLQRHLCSECMAACHSFDDKGNYNYCSVCIAYYLGVGKQRLANLRRIKIEKNQEPLVTMSKKDVLEKKLFSFVVMPAGIDLSFQKWWESIGNVDSVQLHNPVGRHSLSGKTSNNAKEEAMSDFLKFVDLQCFSPKEHIFCLRPLFESAHVATH